MKIVRFDQGDGMARVGSLHGDTITILATEDPLKAPHATAIGTVTLASVKLLTPINRPPKFLGVGLNYPMHSVEAGFEFPEYLRIFNKQGTCMIGPGDVIHKPTYTDSLDFEGELGVVIGSACRKVPEAHALEVIAGYVIVNDISIREWQRRSPTVTLAKSGDTHGPVGPWFVTKDEVPDPQALRVRTLIDGVVFQNFNTAEMIFSIAHTISVLSEIFTLEPGDLIATGTGDGVGVARKPRRYLQAGETVSVEIDGLGSLSNPVIMEPENVGFWTAHV